MGESAEVLPPLRVVAANHPFSVAVIDFKIEAGPSLQAILEKAQPDPFLNLHAHIFIQDQLIPRHLWARVYPKPGAIITIRVLPMGGGGGGKSPLRTILTIAVLAAALAFGGPLGGALFAFGPGGTIAATTIAIGGVGVSTAAIGSAIIGVVGTLLVNAIAPPRQPKMAELGGNPSADSPTLFINGARNAASPFGVVPNPYGENRIVPPLAAQWYSELEGDNQFVRGVVCWGYGPGSLDRFRIGETDLANFDDVELEHRGVIGDCLVLDGSADYFTTPSFTVTAAATFEAFVLTTASAQQIILASRDSSDYGVSLQMDSTGVLRAHYKDSVTESEVLGVTPINDGEWHKVAMVIDGASVKLFVDQDIEADAPGGFLYRNYFAATGGIGADEGGAEKFTGKIDDARLWSIARDAGQIGAPINGLENGLIGWYEFDDEDGTDYSNSGIGDATSHGTPTFADGIAGKFYPHTLYSNDVAEQALSIALNEADGYTTRTSAPGADELSVDLTFGGGLAQFDANGGKTNRTVSMTVQYSVAGAAIWNTVEVVTVTARTTAAVRRGVRWSVPRGQYDVRIKRDTPNTDNSGIVDAVAWTTLRTITHVNPILLPGLMTTAIRIKASGQLNGVVEQLNAVVRRFVRAYAGAESPPRWRWNQFSANPADIYRDVAQGRANKRRLLTKGIDIPALESWWNDCDLAGRTYNSNIDYPTTVEDILADVAASGRASVSRPNGKWSVVVDKERIAVTQYFTPRNSWGFSGEKLFPKIPHGFRVRFINKDMDWNQDERIVFADGYNAQNAADFEGLEMPGVTNPEQIFKDARYHLGVVIGRPEKYNFFADVEHLVCTRGDLIHVTHDVTLWGLSFGRIKEVVFGGSPEMVVQIVVDNACPMQVSGSYNVRVRLSDGTSIVKLVDTVGGDQTTLTFTTPFDIDLLTVPLAAGDLFMFGVAGTESQQLLVNAIEPATDLTARLTCVDYSPESVYYADQGTIPPFNSNITLPLGMDVPAITGVRSDDYVLIRQPDGSFVQLIVITLARIAGMEAKIRGVEIAYRPSGSDTAFVILQSQPIDDGTVRIAGVDDGEIYDIKLRYLRIDGTPGAWTDVIVHRVIGKTLPPPDPTRFVVERLADGTRRFDFAIDGEKPGDLDGFEVRWRSGDKINQTTALLNGTSNEVNLGDYLDSLLCTTTQPWTVEGWFKCDAPGGSFDTLISKWNGAKGFAITIGSAGIITVQLINVATTDQLQVGTVATFHDATWHHYAVTYDGSKTADGLKIYIDGVLLTARQAVINTLTTTNITNANNLCIGSVDSFSFFEGGLAENRIWNYVRSAMQIDQYRDEVVRGDETGLVGYWRMDEGSGSVAIDSSAMGHNGSYTGSLAWVPDDLPIDAFDTMTPLHTGILTSSPLETNELAAGTYVFGCKAIDTSGNKSDNALYIVATLGDPRLNTVLLQRLERAEGWPGVKTDCFVDGDGFLRASGSDWASFAAASPPVTWGDLAGKTWAVITPRTSPMYYETPVLDLGANVSFTPLLTASGQGTISFEMRTGIDGASPPVAGSWQPVTDVISKRYVQFRVEVTDPTAAYLDQFVVLLDGETAIVDYNDIDIATESAPWFDRIGAGHFKVADRTLTLGTITQAQVAAIQNVGAGWTWELVSKAVTVGGAIAAEFKLYNGSGTLADATVDIELRGPKSAS